MMAGTVVTLLDAAVFGPMRAQVGRTLLAMLAIAVGVALGASIYLINRVAADEVSLAARSLYGLADLSLSATEGSFDESVFPAVARLDGIAVASPVVEVEARLAYQRGTIKILGVDAFRYRELQPAFMRDAAETDNRRRTLLGPNTVLLSSQAARELQLGEGQPLQVQVGLDVITFEVIGILPQEMLRERAGLIDIASAQRIFDRLGRLSRIDLRLAAGVSPGAIRHELERRVPAHVRVATPGEAGDDALRLSRAYRSNLTALALVALFTGGFFVYSTQALAVLRRRRELAVLHALGVTRRQQLAFVLCTSALVGVTGSVLGTALGTLLARLGVRTLGTGIGAGYFAGTSAQVSARPGELVFFCALGILVALVGALRPALEAVDIPTASALKAGDVTSAQVRVRGWAIAVALVLSVTVLFVPPVAGLPLPGYVSIALFLVAVVAAMPVLIRTCLRALPSCAAPPYAVAIAELFGTARYAALSVSAIVVSFSLMVAMAIMVASFRGSLDTWTQKILPADLYVRLGDAGETAHLDERTVTQLASITGVARLATSRLAHATIKPDQPPLVVSARSLPAAEIEQTLWITHRTAVSAPGVTPVWLSEVAADLHALKPGDTVELSLHGRRLRAFIQGVWRDYEHQNGAVVIPADDYVRLTGDRAVNTVWLWLEPHASVEEIRGQVRNVLPADSGYYIREPRELRELSLAVFDRTFAITYVLELVAVIIGLFGIAAGISAQVLARRAELGMLRHLGFTRGQIGMMLAIEGALLGTIGVLIGLASGALISLVLIYVVNRQSFHWSMDLYAPSALLAAMSLILVASAALIAVWSGRAAMSSEVLQAVREDW